MSSTTCSETGISAKTPVIFLRSEILQYFSNTDLISEMLVCPVCCCDTSHPSLLRWSNRNGARVEVTLKSTCVLYLGHLGEGKKKAWHFILLLVSSLLPIGPVSLPESQEELPSTVWTWLGCEGSQELYGSMFRNRLKNIFTYWKRF